MACDPPPRAGGPTREAEVAPPETSPPPAQPTADALRAVLETAERFARLESAFITMRRIEEGRKVLERAYGDATKGGASEISVIGSRSGYPSFVIKGTAQRPVRTVTVLGQDVLFGPAGFERFMTLANTRDSTRLASAWLVLSAGLAVEPLGPWSDPITGPPSWRGDELYLSYREEKGAPVTVALTFASDGIIEKRVVHR